MTVQEAINHYRYGITHDIFSEPVTSYAKMSIEALEKQIPKKVVNYRRLQNVVKGQCPMCNLNMLKFPYCSRCGQKLDWEEGGTSD